jgi:hypothetical protein
MAPDLAGKTGFCGFCIVSFLDRFKGTVVQVVQNRNILHSLGERFLVNADPLKH